MIRPIWVCKTGFTEVAKAKQQQKQLNFNVLQFKDLDTVLAVNSVIRYYPLIVNQ